MGAQQLGRGVLSALLFLLIGAVGGGLVATMLSSENESLVSSVTSIDANRSENEFQPKVVPLPAKKPELVKQPEPKEQLEPKEQAEQANKPKPIKAVPVNIPVFASRKDSKPFTSFNGWSDLIVTETGEEWSKVASAKGFPVWISAALVEKLGNSHVRVKINNVNLRSLPQVKGSRVLARAQSGDIMKISRKQGDWLRVWTSVGVAAWAKSKKLRPQNAVSSSVETAM